MLERLDEDTPTNPNSFELAMAGLRKQERRTRG